MSKASLMPSPQERKSAFALASVFAFRMLGLFMILPVFALYGRSIGASPKAIGLALGIYGLTQALLQIPFGMLSDKLGRKPVITMGLILFAIGSLIAAFSHNINGIIIGRAIQGAGAIGSSTIALLADLTREEHRNKAMAIVGMTIGASFMIALILGPIFNQWIGVPGIFGLTAILAILGIVMLYTRVPTPERCVFHRDAEPMLSQFIPLLKNKQLMRLNFGIFAMHASITATFIALPLVLQDVTHLHAAHQWMLYLPVLVIAFMGSIPFIIIAEKRRKLKPIFTTGIAVLVVAQAGMWLTQSSLVGMAISVLLFLTAFTLLEALLPSLVSKVAPTGNKGSAVGIYSSCQFLGIFVGGSVGGLLLAHTGLSGIFAACAVTLAIWFFIAKSMQTPPHLATHMLNLGELNPSYADELTQKLLAQKGVADVVVSLNEGIAYLKVDSQEVDYDALSTLCATETGD